MVPVGGGGGGGGGGGAWESETNILRNLQQQKNQGPNNFTMGLCS